MNIALEIFQQLFTGNPNVYGVHIPAEETVDGEKAKGKSFTKRAPVTQELYYRHILGETSIGISPIWGVNKVNFAAIDIDVYPSNPLKYCKFFSRFHLPFTCFRSKSGGIHAYAFFSDAPDASDVIDTLCEVKAILSLDQKTETFPKQRKLHGDGIGNWINLPYFGGEETSRYAYDDNGKPMSFEAAMAACADKVCTLRSLKAALSKLPFSPAPPCLQTLFMSDEICEQNHNRNTYLFNVATYLKARFGDAFPEKLALVNNALQSPMTQQELERTVILSQKKGDYSYQCELPLFSGVCNKEVCSKREYGKGSDTVSNLSFGKLVQVNALPPYYKWYVNGVEMIFYSEAELRQQEKFMDYCIRHLHKCPNKLKADKWTALLNRSLEQLEMEDVPEDEQLSEETIQKSYIVDFFESRALTPAIGQVKLGKVYFHKEKAAYIFKAEALVDYLESVKRVKTLNIRQLHKILKSLGASAGRFLDKSANAVFRAWVFPTVALAALNGAREDGGEADVEQTVKQEEKISTTVKKTVKTRSSVSKSTDDLIAALEKMDESLEGEELVNLDAEKDDF